MKIQTAGGRMIERGTGWLMCIVLTALPLLPALGGYQSISPWAVGLFRASCILLALLILVLPAELSITGSGRLNELWRPMKQLSAVRILLLGYLGWSFLSALLSDSGETWLGMGRQEGMLTIFCYLFLFWGIAAYGRWKDGLLDLLGIVLLVNAALGILQYGGLNPLGMFPDGADYHDAFILYNGAFLGTLGNVDVLSAFLCLTVPLLYGSVCIGGPIYRLIPMAAGIFLLALADVDSGTVGLGAALALTLPLFLCRRQWRGRTLLALGTLFSAAGAGKLLYADRETALTVRAGVLPVILLLAGAVLILTGLLLKRRQSGGNPRRAFLILLAGITAAGVLGLAGIWLCTGLPGALGELHQILHGNFDPEFGSNRLRIWQEVLLLIREKPLFGGGPDTLVSRMTLTFSRYVAAAGQVVEVQVDTAHNDFLNIAVNQGIPALLFYLGALAAWFVKGMRRMKDEPVLLILMTGVLAYLVQSLFTFSICSVSALFWMVLALGEQLQTTQYEKKARV